MQEHPNTAIVKKTERRERVRAARIKEARLRQILDYRAKVSERMR